VKKSIAGLLSLFLVMALVVVMVAASLSGCGPKEKEPTGSPQGSSDTEPIKFCFLAHVSGDGAV